MNPKTVTAREIVSGPNRSSSVAQAPGGQQWEGNGHWKEQGRDLQYGHEAPTIPEAQGAPAQDIDRAKANTSTKGRPSG